MTPRVPVNVKKAKRQKAQELLDRDWDVAFRRVQQFYELYAEAKQQSPEGYIDIDLLIKKLSQDGAVVMTCGHTRFDHAMLLETEESCDVPTNPRTTEEFRLFVESLEK